MRRIGVFTGIFDPVHYGVVRTAQEALHGGWVDEVIFVPLQAPRNRKPQATYRQRLHMLSLAVQNQQGMLVFEAPKGTETDDPLQAMRAVMHRYKPAEFSVIIGADKLQGFVKAKELRAMLRLGHILVYPRSGFDTFDGEIAASQQGGDVTVLPLLPQDTSSSLVRERIVGLDDALDLIPASVSCQIARWGLYQKPFARLVRNAMQEKRFIHSLGTRETAVELACLHGYAIQKASVAGILHDCAKDMKLAQLQAIAKRYDITRRREVLNNNALLHGPVGAYVARSHYGVEDPDIFNAIYYHTIGRAGMSGLELCVYVADAIEPSRKALAGLEEIRRLARRDLKAAALRVMLSTREYVAASGKNYDAEGLQAIGDLQKTTQ